MIPVLFMIHSNMAAAVCQSAVDPTDSSAAVTVDAIHRSVCAGGVGGGGRRIWWLWSPEE